LSDVTILSHKVDYAIGVAATTAPWWMPYFNDTVHVLLLVGGVLLVILRVGIAWKEWRAKKRGE
jgi:hypothetical protein